MPNKSLFDTVSRDCSVNTTKKYSTSFSLGIRTLHKSIRPDIYAIYGFVRFADEIVDTFHAYDKRALFTRFKEDTYLAIDQKISLNPILNSFQEVINKYEIDLHLVDTFLKSMEMDLNAISYNQESYEEYILGSAEVVGLMCLQVFLSGNKEEYERLKPHAMSLGAAFQKINFLRDLKEDYKELGRVYFPGLDMRDFDCTKKAEIEKDIERDFKHALEGIRQLPKSSRMGVFLAYRYYHRLFLKIKVLPAPKIMSSRIRINNSKKLSLLMRTYVKHSLNLL
jgi:phytoene/squalene synthetase